MPRLIAFALAVMLAWVGSSFRAKKQEFKVGAAAIAITPFGPNPDWDGGITESGVWGERFTDANRNGRWDAGEPFEDDPGNTALDESSRGKYDGIYLAGFGKNRIATAKHDDLWARAIAIEAGATKIVIVSIDRIDVKKATLRAPMDNEGYMFLASKGVLDIMKRTRQARS